MSYVLPEEYKQYLRQTEFPVRDMIYNKLIEMHAKRGKLWTTHGLFSDKLFWSAGLDHVYPWIPVLIFLYVIYFLANFIFVHYGLFRAVAFLAVMCLIRVNTLIRKVDLTNRILKGQS